jgi:hypothetical protein
MNYYTELHPDVIQERRQQVLREVDSLRLKKQLCDDRGSSGSWALTLARRSTLPLLRRAGLVR